MKPYHLRDFIYRIVSALCGYLHPRVVVFCYHSFSSDWRYSVSAQNLAKQLEYLSKQTQFIDAKQFQGYQSKPISGALLTIDDGYADVYSIAPLLVKYHIKPILFCIADPKNANRHELATDKPFLNTKQLKTLISQGWSIGCHSLNHPDFSTLTDDQAKDQIITSKNLLEERLGIKVDYFAYPKGVYSKKVMKLVKQAGYKLAFSMDDAVIDAHTNCFAIPRVGVDQTHSPEIFKSIYTLGSIWFRSLVKRSIIKGVIA